MKRYVVTIDMYVYAENDDLAVHQAKRIAKELDLDDNKAAVTEICEQSFGQLTNRKIDHNAKRTVIL